MAQILTSLSFGVVVWGILGGVAWLKYLYLDLLIHSQRWRELERREPLE